MSSVYVYICCVSANSTQWLQLDWLYSPCGSIVFSVRKEKCRAGPQDAECTARSSAHINIALSPAIP
ncbi:unnamed protein product [Parnassius apollo]|uniref:(apollo) hypothetical protein n=1 Tax=Parnassius apollo TaxID=110799 RepID=A0A8S3WKK5_PARAO|nr:unnamed protein product [Parnassius apollo]